RRLCGAAGRGGRAGRAGRHAGRPAPRRNFHRFAPHGPDTMCLIVFAWRVIPGVPLIACANRDEFYDRPATPAAPWPDNPNIVAGRDLQGGGSWMGVTKDGLNGPKFAALTNILSPHDVKP